MEDPTPQDLIPPSNPARNTGFTQSFFGSQGSPPSAESPSWIGQCITNLSGQVRILSEELAVRLGIPEQEVSSVFFPHYLYSPDTTRLPFEWEQLVQSGRPTSLILKGKNERAWRVSVQAMLLPQSFYPEGGYSLSCLFEQEPYAVVRPVTYASQPKSARPAAPALGEALLSPLGTIKSWNRGFKEALWACFGLSVETEPIYHLMLQPESSAPLRRLLFRALTGEANTQVFPCSYDDSKARLRWEFVPLFREGSRIGLRIEIYDVTEDRPPTGTEDPQKTVLDPLTLPSPRADYRQMLETYTAFGYDMTLITAAYRGGGTELPILYANGGFGTTFGYGEEIMGKNVWEVLFRSKHEDAVWIDDLKKQIFQQEYIRVEGALLDAKGSLLWAEVLVVPQFEQVSQVQYFLFLIRNISRRKETEQTLRATAANLSALVNNTSDIALSLDRDLRLLTFNGAYQQLIYQRFGKEIHVGQSILDALPSDRRAIWEPLFARVLGGETVQQDMEAQNQGHLQYLGLKISPIKDGDEVIGCTLFLRDVTERTLVEQRLRRSEAYQRAILDNTPSGFYLIEKDGTLLTYNRYAQEEISKGIELADYIGKSLIQLIAPENRSDMLKQIERAWEDEVVIGTYFDPLPDGENRWIAYRYAPCHDQDGHPIGVLVSLQDVTPQYEAELQQAQLTERFLLATEAAQLGIWDWDLQSGQIQLDRNMCKHFGREATQALLQEADWKEMLGPEGRDQLDKALQEATANKQGLAFTHRVEREGETYYLQTRANIHYGETGTAEKLIGATWDVTSAHTAEQALRLGKERAEEMSRLKGNFLDNMSHEVRTPLNGIINLIESLEGESDVDLIHRMLQIIKRSGKRLFSTLTGILELSRLEAERKGYVLEQINMQQMLAECIEYLEPNSVQKGLDFAYRASEQPLQVLGDGRMLRLIFHNIIGNALKFTHKGEVSVHLDAYFSTEGQSFARIVVQDTGIGIAPEFLDHLFEPYTQESSGMMRDYEGTGIGLSIAKRYTELLGGTIVVKSEKGRGSTFTIDLPLSS